MSYVKLAADTQSQQYGFKRKITLLPKHQHTWRHSLYECINLYILTVTWSRAAVSKFEIILIPETNNQ